MLSALFVAALILSINFAPVPDKGTLVLGLAVIAPAALIAFVIRQRRARHPLYDLHVAGRRTFWVAAVGGIIVFGALMGGLFIGQQYMQNVLGYSTLDAGLATLPMAALMVLVAPGSAKLVNRRGSRITLIAGFAFLLLGFLAMLLLWQESIPYWKVGLAYALVGIGVGLAGTPASHCLTASVPVRRAGAMPSRHRRPAARPRRRDHAVDPRRPARGGLRRRLHRRDRRGTQQAADHHRRPERADQSPTPAQPTPPSGTRSTPSQITAAAKTSFLKGDQWAYTAGIIADPGRAGARLLPVPQETAGGGPAGRLPRRGRGQPGGGTGAAAGTGDDLPWRTFDLGESDLCTRGRVLCGPCSRAPSRDDTPSLR